MNKQEIFNTVARHLLEQGTPSLDAEGACAYRGVDGTSCAVGCLIKDEDYTSYFEGKSVWNADVKCALAASIGEDYILSDETEFLGHLQKIHDRVDPQNWKASLAELAEHHGLEFNA